MQEPFDSQLNNHFAIVNSLGRTVLIETLKMAAYYVSHSDMTTESRTWKMHLREAKSCYMFIQGTGLGMLIHRFNLSYEPDSIRETFNYCVRKSA